MAFPGRAQSQVQAQSLFDDLGKWVREEVLTPKAMPKSVSPSPVLSLSQLKGDWKLVKEKKGGLLAANPQGLLWPSGQERTLALIVEGPVFTAMAMGENLTATYAQPGRDHGTGPASLEIGDEGLTFTFKEASDLGDIRTLDCEVTYTCPNKYLLPDAIGCKVKKVCVGQPTENFQQIFVRIKE